MKTLAVLRQLTWVQRRTLLVALVLLPSFAVLLRVGSPARFLLRQRGHETPGALADARAAARAVNLVAARLHATCLTRSLVLHRILAGRGIATMLRVGVRNEAGRVQAHAWLECGGVPVNDTAHGVRGFALLELP